MPAPAIIIIANIHSEGLVSPVFGEPAFCAGLADAGCKAFGDASCGTIVGTAGAGCGVIVGITGAGVVSGGVIPGSGDTMVSTYVNAYVENRSVSKVNICVAASKLPSRTAATPSCILITL